MVLKGEHVENRTMAPECAICAEAVRWDDQMTARGGAVNPHCENPIEGYGASDYRWVHIACTGDGVRRWIREGRPGENPLQWVRSEDLSWYDLDKTGQTAWFVCDDLDHP
jgi:hypothetical protein